MDPRHELGNFGEDIAESYLARQGLVIVTQNFRTDFGEIDLIARDHEAWVFIEVKTRTNDQQTSAAEAITLAKQHKIIRSALVYLKLQKLHDVAVRFDVVLIEENSIEWIADAFQTSGYTR